MQRELRKKAPDVVPSKVNIQKKIRPKIRSLLKTLGASDDIIAAYTRGYCNGLVTVALYSCFIDALNQENPQQRSSYDWAWFDTLLKRIADWDAKSIYSFSQDEFDDILYLIGQLEFYQHCSTYMSYSQGTLHKILQNSRNRIPQLEYTIAGLFRQADFFKKIFVAPDSDQQTSLIDILLKCENRIITISRGGHSLGIFRTGNKVIFYNANSGRKDFDLQHLPDLVAEIYAAYKFDVNKPCSLGFRIHTFADKLEKYVNVSYVLAQLAVPLKYEDNSAIHLAARIGSKECVKYYLKNGSGANDLSKTNASVLYIAALKGHYSTVKVLLKNKGNINQRHEDGSTPLSIAAKNGHVNIVRLMLESQQNFTIENLFIALTHFKHDRERLKLLQKLDKNKLVTVHIKRKSMLKTFQAHGAQNEIYSAYRNQIYNLFPSKIKSIPSCRNNVEEKRPGAPLLIRGFYV